MKELKMVSLVVCLSISELLTPDKLFLAPLKVCSNTVVVSNIHNLQESQKLSCIAMPFIQSCQREIVYYGHFVWGVRSRRKGKLRMSLERLRLFVWPTLMKLNELNRTANMLLY